MCQWRVFLISPALNSANACSLFSFLISLKQKKNRNCFFVVLSSIGATAAVAAKAHGGGYFARWGCGGFFA